MSTNTSSTKNGSQDMPINYAALSQAYIEAIETTLTDHGVNETAEIINEISSHADSLIELNGEEFIWKNDLEHFMDIIDPLCDTLYSNGYEDIIGRLDDLRQEKLELPKTPDGMDDIIIDESGIELATNLNKSTYGNRWGEITFSSEGIGMTLYEKTEDGDRTIVDETWLTRVELTDKMDGDTPKENIVLDN